MQISIYQRNSLKILFLIGSPDLNGGTYVIVEHAAYAMSKGHDVTLLSMEPPTIDSLAWHPALAQLKVLHIDDYDGKQADLAIATFWRTTFELARVNARQYAYFVQSIESRFYPDHDINMRRLVDCTYQIGLPGITEAEWIRQHLEDNYGSNYFLAHNGIRKDLYTTTGPSHAPRKGARLRCLVEGSLKSPHIKNTARTARLVRSVRGIESWLLTPTVMRWYPGFERLFCRLSVPEVPDVYRSCDVLIKLSLVEGMFGPPLEMFHCGGTAVVYKVSGHEEYIRHSDNALVAPLHDEARVREYIIALRDDRALLGRLQAGAQATAADWPGWPESSSRFLQHLHALMDEQRVSRIWLADKLISLRGAHANAFATQNGHIASETSSHPWTRHAKARLNESREWIGYVLDGYR